MGSELTRFMNNLPQKKKKKKNHSIIALLELDGLKLICFIDIINYGQDQISLLIFFVIQVSDRLSVC